MNRAEKEALILEAGEDLALIKAVCPAEVVISLDEDAQACIRRLCVRVEHILFTVSDNSDTSDIADAA